ncbi:MAG: hypothetical protein WCE54_16325 [Ignavibacteriaceae bacterium]
MKKIFIVFFFLSSLMCISYAQSTLKWIIGGRFGLSVASSGGGAGLQIGPMGELLFNRNMGVGTELNINTQSGTPIEWADYFKYYFDIPDNPNIKPYADAGFSLWFVSGGPYFGIRFGGGVNFKVAPNIYIPADIQMGPVFYGSSGGGGYYDYFGNYYGGSSTSSTIFYFAITTGIRYELP